MVRDTPRSSPARAGAEAEPARPGSAEARGSSGHRWTFLSNHAHVLILLHADPRRVLRDVAARVGITERAVQRIIHELEAEGYLERTRVGRQNIYRVMTERPLRHPVEAHRSVGDLLDLIAERPAPSDGR